MSKKRFSSKGHSKSMSHGESTGTSFTTNYGHSGTTTLSKSSDDHSAQSSMRVRHAAERLDLEVRTLAKTFTVQEFLSLRAKVEDSFDSVLLSSRF